MRYAIESKVKSLLGRSCLLREHSKYSALWLPNQRPKAFLLFWLLESQTQSS